MLQEENLQIFLQTFLLTFNSSRKFIEIFAKVSTEISTTGKLCRILCRKNTTYLYNKLMTIEIYGFNFSIDFDPV